MKLYRNYTMLLQYIKDAASKDSYKTTLILEILTLKRTQSRSKICIVT